MNPTQVSPHFEEPVYVADPSGCFFYHSMDLPHFGLQIGHWDIRKDVDNYLGNQNFQGKSVIDIGTASGFLAFEMEKRGAEVIAFDRDLADTDDDVGLIPFHNFERRFGVTFQHVVEQRIAMQRKLRNSFWLSHRLLKSNVRLHAGNVYTGIRGIAPVDYCFFGNILLHLRDPLRALSVFAPLVREKIIVTETREDIGKEMSDAPVLFFRPNLEDLGNVGTWWYLTPAVVKQFLQILGFSKFSLTTHQAVYVQAGRPLMHYTLVASR
ncbi:MAG TPA: hypothetical protein VH639_11985 [Bryobacteraceae bacterium]